MSFYENLVMQTQMNYSRFHRRRTVGIHRYLSLYNTARPGSEALPGS